MNPNGVVPTIEDGGDHLGKQHHRAVLGGRVCRGSLWPNDPGERSQAERWMDWQLSTIHTGMRDIFWGWIRTPTEKRDMAAITKTAADMGKLSARLDEKLAGNSMSQVAFYDGRYPAGCWIHSWYALSIERPELTNVRGRPGSWRR